MAFILKKTASIKWPVVIKKASDGGKFKEHKFDAVFKEIGRDRFNKLIDEGVSREIARINLPLSTFTEFYFSIDLHKFFIFFTKRKLNPG